MPPNYCAGDDSCSPELPKGEVNSGIAVVHLHEIVADSESENSALDEDDRIRVDRALLEESVKEVIFVAEIWC